MYHHTVVVLLFRPFLKVELRQILSLASTYKSIYGLRCSIVVLIYLISTTCITYLLDLPDPSVARNLEQGIRNLNEMTENHTIAKRYLNIIIGLCEQWRMRLPERVVKAPKELKSEGKPGALPFTYLVLLHTTTDHSSIRPI